MPERIDARLALPPRSLARQQTERIQSELAELPSGCAIKMNIDPNQDYVGAADAANRESKRLILLDDPEQILLDCQACDRTSMCHIGDIVLKLLPALLHQKNS